MKRLFISIFLIFPLIVVADEYREDFSFTEQPYVHPNVVAAFDTLADTGHLITAINLPDANDSNLYYGDYRVRSEWVENVPEEDGCSFGYSHRGVSDSGIHALLTYGHCGGSGTYYSIMLVKLERDPAYEIRHGNLLRRTKMKEYPRFVIKLMGTMAIGDRWSGPVMLKDNRLHVGPNTGAFAGKETGNPFQDAKEEIVIDLSQQE